MYILAQMSGRMSWCHATGNVVSVKCAELDHESSPADNAHAMCALMSTVDAEQLVVDVDVAYSKGAKNCTFFQLLPHISEIQARAFDVHGRRISAIRIFPIGTLAWPLHIALKVILPPERFALLQVCESSPSL